MTEPHLFHFSEDPDIKLFTPRVGRQIEGRPSGEKLVWAIDGHHSPVYLFPRQCPRIVLWPVEGSTQDDIGRWIPDKARMVAHIEAAWAKRFSNCELYRYSFDANGFENLHDHGVHVNPNPVEPESVTRVGSLSVAAQSENVEIKVMDSLQPLSEAWFSTLHFSGIRLKNARNWTSPA